LSNTRRKRIRTDARPALDLPPPFRLVTLREVGDAFTHAQAVAASEGAGTLVQVGRFDLIEFAVVLEPEEPLVIARCAFYAGLNALGNALAAHAPPERAISFTWPDVIHVGGGLIGGARLAWPIGADEKKPPEWLVFSAMVRTVGIARKDAGLHTLPSALEEQGFENLDSGRLLESFARYLMLAIDTWQTDGFMTIAHDYLRRTTHEKRASPALDANGDLLVRWPGHAEPERHSLREALRVATWLDALTGERGTRPMGGGR
jgi:hypothetical protein